VDCDLDFRRVGVSVFPQWIAASRASPHCDRCASGVAVFQAGAINAGSSLMAHPKGGSGTRFNPQHRFPDAYAFVGTAGVTVSSTKGDRIEVRRGIAGDRVTPTLVFTGERNVHGRACAACWGFRKDCNGSWIGQCAEVLDTIMGN
jgi:hypothetical protein